MEEDEIVVACTSVIFVSLGAASVMADAMADAKQESPANAKGTRDSSACMKAHC